MRHSAHLRELVVREGRRAVRQVVDLDSVARVRTGLVPGQRRRARAKHDVQVIGHRVMLVHVLHSIMR